MDDPSSPAELAPPDPTASRSFIAMLAALEDGTLANRLSDEMRTMVAELTDTARDQGGKPAGTITLSLGFKLDDGMIEVRAAVTSKMPRTIRPRSMFWATPENNLTQRNPMQRELPLREVSLSAATVRSI